MQGPESSNDIDIVQLMANVCENRVDPPTTETKFPLFPKPVCNDRTNDSWRTTNEAAEAGLAMSGYSVQSNVMTWQALLSLYADALPITVLSVGSALPKNTVMILHHTKRVHVVTVETLGGDLYDIPLNTSLLFALLYNPTNNVQTAMQGFAFPSIASILRASPRPKLVCSKSAWSDGKVSIVENELLILGREMQKAETQTTEGIVAYSLNTKSSKLIPIKCQCMFTTGASDVCLPLPEITAYIPDIFPALACIFNHDHNAPTFSKIVTLKTERNAPVVVTEPLTGGEAEVVFDSQMSPEQVAYSSAPVQQLYPHTPMLFLPFNLPHLDVIIVHRTAVQQQESHHHPVPCDPVPSCRTSVYAVQRKSEHHSYGSNTEDKVSNSN